LLVLVESIEEADKLTKSHLFSSAQGTSMAEPLTVACEHCSSKLKLKSAAAVGKKVACPKCKKVFTVRAPAEKTGDDLFDDLPLDNYEAPEEEPKEEDEEPAPRSKGKTGAKGKKGGKKRKSSGSDVGGLLMTVLFVLLGVGGVGGIGYALFQFLPSGSGGIAAYLPDEVDTVFHVRVAELIASPLVAPLMNDPKVKEAIDKGVKETGMQPGDIESVTFGAVGAVGSINQNAFGPPSMGAPVERYVAVVKTKAPINLEQVKTSLKIQATAANHNGQEYFTTTNNGKMVAYFRPNETTLVIAPEAELKAAIDSKGAAPARSRFKYIDLSQHVIVAFGPKDISLFRTKMGVVSMRIDPTTGAKTPSTDDIVSGMSFGLKLTSDIIARNDTRYNSSSTARNSVASHKQELADGKERLDEMKGQLGLMTLAMPGLSGPVNRIADYISKAMGSATVTPSGATLTTQLTIPGAIANDFKELASAGMTMMEQQALGGGGGFPFPGTSPGLPSAGVISPGFPAGAADGTIPAGFPPGFPGGPTPMPGDAPPSSASPAAPAGTLSPPVGSPMLPTGSPMIPVQLGAPPTGAASPPAVPAKP